MIIAAAIRFGDKVYTDKCRHSEIAYNIIRSNPDARPELFEYGFITSEGEFVGREEAYEIAIACGQVEDTPTCPKSLSTQNLKSF